MAKASGDKHICIYTIYYTNGTAKAFSLVCMCVGSLATNSFVLIKLIKFCTQSFGRKISSEFVKLTKSLEPFQNGGRLKL